MYITASNTHKKSSYPPKYVVFKWFLYVVFALLNTTFSQAQRFSGSIHEQDSLLQIEEDDSLYVLRATDLSRTIHKKNHNAELEYKYIDKAIDRALSIEDTVLYARALDVKGLLYRQHQWYEQAVPLHIRAYELVEHRDGNIKDKMIFANNTGVAARYNKQNALAVTYYLKALKLAEKHDAPRDVAIASNGLGIALNNISDREDEALNYFKIAIETERKRENDLGLAMNLLSISDYYINNGNREKAFSHLSELKEINEKQKDTYGLALTNATYGQAYQNLDQDWDKAKVHYEKAYEAYRKIDNHQKKAYILIHLGDIEKLRSNFGKALDFYNSSLAIAKNYRYKSILQQTHEKISEIKEEQGLLPEAFEHYKMAQIYKDSVGLANQKVKIDALRYEYDLAAHEDKIALLQKDQDLKEEQINSQQNEIKAQRLFLWILLIGAVLIILFVVVQIRNLKSKRIAEQKLQLKEKYLLEAEYERNLAQAEMLVSRLQINPHFIFNCLNAIKLLIQKKETKAAQKYLTTFSRFIRMVLEMPKQETISLEKELELIRYYLDLEKKRFSEKIDFTINTNVKTCLEDIKIPPLLLQPFVENAIWHGLLPSKKPYKSLNIDIVEKEHQTLITIDDNGVGLNNNATATKNPSKRKQKRKKLGTKITKERIRQFNQNYDLKINLQLIDKPSGSGTQVLLTIVNKTEPSLKTS